MLDALLNSNFRAFGSSVRFNSTCPIVPKRQAIHQFSAFLLPGLAEHFEGWVMNPKMARQEGTSKRLHHRNQRNNRDKGSQGLD